MDPISIALGLAQFVPSLAKWLGGDKAGDVAQKAVDVAKAVTGKASGDDALSAIKADPQLALQYQQSMMAQEVALYQEDSKRLESVNATMRAEAASNTWWQSGWRPFWGFTTGAAFSAQMLGVTFQIFVHPDQVNGVVAGLAQLTAMWGLALAVLGVAVWKRTTEKQIAADLASGGASSLPPGAKDVAGLPWQSKG